MGGEGGGKGVLVTQGAIIETRAGGRSRRGEKSLARARNARASHSDLLARFALLIRWRCMLMPAIAVYGRRVYYTFRCRRSTYGSAIGDREAVYVGYEEEIHRHMCSRSDPRSRSARSPVKQLKL